MIIFTSKKTDDVARLGGTGWWKVNPVRAQNSRYVVLTHNAFDKRRPGDSDRHGEAFMVATIRDVLQDEDGRWLIQFDLFSEASTGLKWPGYRNPITYVDTDDVIDELENADWRKADNVPFEKAQSIRRREDGGD